MTSDIFSLLIVAVSGAGGGFLNPILIERKLSLPCIECTDSGKKSIDLGFIGNMLIGVGASLVVWGFGGAHSVATPELVGTSVLSGICGAAILLNILQQKNLDLQENKMEALKDLFKEQLNTQFGEKENQDSNHKQKKD